MYSLLVLVRPNAEGYLQVLRQVRISRLLQLSGVRV